MTANAGAVMMASASASAPSVMMGFVDVAFLGCRRGNLGWIHIKLVGSNAEDQNCVKNFQDSTAIQFTFEPGSRLLST